MRPASGPVLPTAEWCRLSEGELHYVWWFIQGSIMEADVRWRLRRAWGMCQRHAWGVLAAEAAFRHNYFHGPAILYQDLLERALRAFELMGPWPASRLARRFRPTGRCMMCEMGFDRRSRGTFSQERVDEGRDLTMIREFAAATRKCWAGTVCGKCSGEGTRSRCRPHLLEDVRSGAAGDLALHRGELDDILDRLTVYARSFRWECRNTETDRDRAALLSAVGWCSGWEGGLALLAASA
jgi:hypothetical protein